MANKGSAENITEGNETAKEEVAPAGAPVSESVDERAGKQGDAAISIANLEKERADLYDRLLRKQAEMENYRKRIEREKADWYHQGVIDVIKEFLPVIDACERALASFKAVPDPSGAVHTYREGVELIYKQFELVLKKFGVTPVEAVGAGFDPYVHEAFARVESEEHEENVVVEELQKGYRHREKLLRPAVVKVSTKPSKVASAERTTQGEAGPQGT